MTLRYSGGRPVSFALQCCFLLFVSTLLTCRAATERAAQCDRPTDATETVAKVEERHADLDDEHYDVQHGEEEEEEEEHDEDEVADDEDEEAGDEDEVAGDEDEGAGDEDEGAGDEDEEAGDEDEEAGDEDEVDDDEDEVEDIFVRNADPNQPLLQSVENALAQPQIDALQACLRDHPMQSQNVNDGDVFNGTRGFLLSFTERGIPDMEKSELFGCLSDYFHKYRLDRSNAWVLNMVWADVPDYKKNFTIELHTDDAIVLNYTGSYRIMPVQTNVLYVFVPERMEGGQLEAWDYDASDAELDGEAQGSVVPRENRMAFFRGDARHQVRSYRAPMKDKLRGSLVLEQYDVPEEAMPYVVEWHWAGRQSGGEMM